MQPAERMELIRSRMQQQFSPTTLQVQDDSEKHKGHAGSRGGAGHYTLTIAAATFNHKSPVDVHREIYALLDDLIPHEIHALVIKILTV
jgi:BolA protein